MRDVQSVVDGYIAMWNEPAEEARRSLVAETLTEDATYVDPLMAGEGVDGITAMIGAAQQQFPGLRFRLHAGPDAHHDRVRYTWQLHGDDGTAIATGVDFATLAEDGRLREVVGFLEQ